VKVLQTIYVGAATTKHVAKTTKEMCAVTIYLLLLLKIRLLKQIRAGLFDN